MAEKKESARYQEAKGAKATKINKLYIFQGASDNATSFGKGKDNALKPPPIITVSAPFNIKLSRDDH